MRYPLCFDLEPNDPRRTPKRLVISAESPTLGKIRLAVLDVGPGMRALKAVFPDVFKSPVRRRKVKP